VTAPDDLATLGACTLDKPGPAEAGRGCSVCGEAAVPVRVVREIGPARVLVEDRTGQTAEIATAFTPDARPGDILLVSAGVALSHLPAAPAA
jgi:hypothetical protein